MRSVTELEIAIVVGPVVVVMFAVIVSPVSTTGLGTVVVPVIANRSFVRNSWSESVVQSITTRVERSSQFASVIACVPAPGLPM